MTTASARVAGAIWGEAFHAGARYALAIQPARIVVSAEKLGEIIERTPTP